MNKLFFILCLCFTINLIGQEWVQYSVDDGLPHNYVFSIIQDDEGNMWFTGYEGATKFDGENMSVYTAENGLAETYNWDMWCDRDGNIWFSGSSADSVSMFDGSNFHITPLPGAFEECIYEDVNGNIWFGDYSGEGIIKFDGSDWILYAMDYDYGVKSIWGDNEGGIFFSVKNSGTYKFEGENWIEFETPLIHEADEIYYDFSERLWFFGYSDAAYYHDGTWMYYSDSIYPGGAKDISEDSQGNLWIANGSKKSITIIEGDSFTTIDQEDGLLDATMYSVKVDWYDNIWIGSSEGVSHYIINEYAEVSQEVTVNDEGDILYVTFPQLLFEQFELGTNISFQGLTSDNTLPDWISFNENSITFALNFSSRYRSNESILLRVRATDEDEKTAVVSATVDISAYSDIIDDIYGNKLTIQPNPFTTSTTIAYELKQPEKVSLNIYNHLGQLIYQTQERQPQGKQRLIWNAEKFADGIYYYRLQAGDDVDNGKMVKVK